MALTNPGFETGDYTGWEQLSRSSTPLPTINISSTTGYVESGTYSAHVQSPGSGEYEVKLRNEWRPLIAPESVVTVNARCKGGPEKGGQFVSVGVDFFDAANNRIAVFSSEEVRNNALRGGFVSVGWSGRAPAGAASVSMWVLPRVNTYSNRHIYIDSCTMSVTEITGEAVSITFPVTGATYPVGDTIPFRVSVLAGTPIASLKYLVTNTTTAATTEIPSTGADWRADVSTLPEASYSVVAKTTLTNNTTITSNAHTFTVGAAAALPTREYKASNAYTQLVLQNFDSLSASMPPTAVVTGAEMELSYSLKLLIRSKDKDLDALTAARYEAALAVAPSVTISAQALEPQSNSLVAVGTPMAEVLQLRLSDFSVTEDGTSEGHRWTVLENKATTVTIGTEGSVFGLTNVQAGNFIDYAIGIRAFPQFGSVPEWADSGDACIRVLIDRVRLRVYFDAGSVDYYFVNEGSEEVIKGTLGAVYVDGGDLTNGDGRGIMQLLPVTEPNSSTIYEGAAIHSAYPVTAKNRIGTVDTRMVYNGLPTYNDVLVDNRSRYLFTTANFYGTPTLNSIYGVNGVDRGFAYNGEFFYKLTTHPVPEEDRPRHVAYHHGHLALGYNSGRVDLSVVGEPWNFDGAAGASSWAIGDEVTGLLPLPGTMLGIYGKKSITGLSGTTVDNFTTQVISPKLGAVEYTVTDMGFPVHANAYGIYTLSQTADYGDYLGVPLSQQVSPWLRPRLVRSSTSSKEVVVAWPVRSKNQYKLAFADGYVLTMTMNYGNQSTPTFSKQKYFIGSGPYGGDTPPAPAAYNLERPALVPAAISSELDDSGEERIHVANKVIPTAGLCAAANDAIGASWNGNLHNKDLVYLYMTNTPSWLYPTDTGFAPAIHIDFYNTGDAVPYYYASQEVYGYTGWHKDGEYPTINAPASGHGTIYNADMSQSVCFDWEILGGA